MPRNPLPGATRREFLRAAGTGAAANLLAAPSGGQAASTPNIVWITCEDMSPDLGCYGDAYARSPHIDQLATQGARYRQAFSVSGVCAPSRSAIITGMYPTTMGTMHMRTRAVPPPEVKCFPEYLRAAGYYCTNNVKTDYQFDPPVTAWDASSREAHWRNGPRGKPFFAVFNLTVTHEGQIRSSPEQFAQNTRRLKPADRHDPAAAVLPPYYPDTPVVRRDWANYHDLITAMDLQVADLLKQLDDDGLTDKTVVFFYSDHGRGLPRAKRWIYDSGLHVPLIVRWPGHIEPGSVVDDLVSFVDFGPTALSLAGVQVPSHMQGRAFLGAQKRTPRQFVYAARDRMDETSDIIRAVRDRRFKYIRNYEPEKVYAQHIAYMDEMPTMQEWRRLHAEGKLAGAQETFFETKPVEELYDTQADPHEVDNLARKPEHQQTLERMRQAHEQWRQRTRDLGLIPEPELMERMRPGGVWQTTAEPQLTPPGGSYQSTVRVRLTCPTQGASIAYTTEAGPTARWKLYSGEISLETSANLRAKAVRLGFQESPEVKAAFRVG